jgi:hypothetical protein
LENTLPGRDGYDVEIFGMEGVPAKDKDEWSENDLKLALDQHKMLMSGGKLGSLPGMPMGGLPG